MTVELGMEHEVEVLGTVEFPGGPAHETAGPALGNV